MLYLFYVHLKTVFFFFLRLENEKLKIQKQREEIARMNAQKSDNEKVNECLHCLASLSGRIHYNYNTIGNHPYCAPLC